MAFFISLLLLFSGSIITGILSSTTTSSTTTIGLNNLWTVLAIINPIQLDAYAGTEDVDDDGSGEEEGGGSSGGGSDGGGSDGGGGEGGSSPLPSPPPPDLTLQETDEIEGEDDGGNGGEDDSGGGANVDDEDADLLAAQEYGGGTGGTGGTGGYTITRGSDPDCGPENYAVYIEDFRVKCIPECQPWQILDESNWVCVGDPPPPPPTTPCGEGYIRDEKGGCIPRVVPCGEGYIRDEKGGCVRKEVCPNAPSITFGLTSVDRYDIHASTLAMVKEQFKFTSDDGKEKVGFDWDLKHISSDIDPKSGCLKSIIFKMTLKMPRWINYDTLPLPACNNVKDEWIRFLMAAIKHEQNHEQKAIAFFKKEVEYGELGKEFKYTNVKAEIEDVIRKLAEAQRTEVGRPYDSETNHGATEGAYLDTGITC
jgi:hypothetical protein